jgi:hypothetical protein
MSAQLYQERSEASRRAWLCGTSIVIALSICENSRLLVDLTRDDGEADPAAR